MNSQNWRCEGLLIVAYMGNSSGKYFSTAFNTASLHNVLDAFLKSVIDLDASYRGISACTNCCFVISILLQKTSCLEASNDK